MCRNNESTDQASLLGRIVDRHPTAAKAGSLTCWLAAVGILAAYANGHGFSGVTGFMLTESWLIGVGCIGAPVYMLEYLGRHMTIRALELIAATCFTVAIIVSVFLGTGQAHIAPWTACFLLILFLALGIQAANGAYSLYRRRQIEQEARAEERAERDKDVQAARLIALAEARATQQQRTRELERMLNADTEEFAAITAAFLEEQENRRMKKLGGANSAQILHFVRNQQRGDDLPPTGSDQD